MKKKHLDKVLFALFILFYTNIHLNYQKLTSAKAFCIIKTKSFSEIYVKNWL